MPKYRVHMRVPNHIPAERDFFALLNKFHTVGYSNSKRNTQAGDAYFAIISSEEPITLTRLRKEFPEITISRLEKAA